jgi:hypothetical protein
VTAAVLGASGFVGRSTAFETIVALVDRLPTVAKDERIRDLVPFELTGFDDAAREALE